MTTNELVMLVIAIFTLAVGIAAHAVALFFKSPKEGAQELSDRLKAVEDDHELVARVVAKHDVVVQHLADAVKELASEIKGLRETILRKLGAAGVRR